MSISGHSEKIRRKIVLISCASKKLPQRAKAKDLYISPLFNLNVKYAEKLTPDDIFILSAKHGLLGLEEEVDPYDKTLNEMPAAEVKDWAKGVAKQLKAICSLEDSVITFLAGAKYRKYLTPHLRKFEVPLEGLGIGKQLQKLRGLVK